MKMLRVEGLSKSFYVHHLGKEIRVLNSVSLELEKGEFLCITGKSGAGKSTLLKCIHMTYTPSEGKVEYNSALRGWVNLTELSHYELNQIRKREIGYVSQFLKVLPRVSVYELVFRSALSSLEEEEAHRFTRHILKSLLLEEELWDVYPAFLSGGQQQKLNIAIALAKRPRLLLLDEPTSALDGKSRERVYQILLEQKRAGVAIVGVFHEVPTQIVDKYLNLEVCHEVCD